MCMYFTNGINQDGYILCRYCNMKKYEHPIFSYIYNMTSQCDDIILLIQDYIKFDVQTIKGGGNHIIVLLQDNTVKCWGNNMDSQCNVPDSIQGKVISISSGFSHSIAILNDNTVKCWGYNCWEQFRPQEELKIMRKN